MVQCDSWHGDGGKKYYLNASGAMQAGVGRTWAEAGIIDGSAHDDGAGKCSRRCGIT